MRTISALLLASLVAAVEPAAALVTVVDTGAGAEMGGGSTLANTSFIQFLAGQFTLADPTTVDTVEGWLVTTQAGSIDFDLLSDNLGHPGSSLFTTTVASSMNGIAHWESASGLGWVLAPGTYWIAFEPQPGYQGYMPGMVLAPLAKYAFATADPPSWTIASSGAFGVRVFAVPEPNAGALALAACAAVASVRARRRRPNPTSRFEFARAR